MLVNDNCNLLSHMIFIFLCNIACEWDIYASVIHVLISQCFLCAVIVEKIIFIHGVNNLS